jgi:hypothetical protein
MISKISFVVALLTVIFYGCGSDKKDPLIINNDFESIKGWGDLSGVTDMAAHSGNYSLITDSEHNYSKTFKIKFKNISDKKIKGMAFTAWCYADAIPIKGSIVMAVKNDSVNNVLYNGTDLENFISEAKQWVKVSGKIDFSEHVSDPENEFGFYIWNTGKNKILTDDITIKFIE